jgi:hypothetical protein
MPGCFVESSVKDFFFCVALTAGELVVGHILVISIGVSVNGMPRVSYVNVMLLGNFQKKENFTI